MNLEPTQLMRRIFGFLFVWALLVATVAAAQEVSLVQDAAPVASAADLAFFNGQVAPLLQRRCYACHSHESGKAKGGLVLDSREGWRTGGVSGPAVIPGNLNESLLIEAVRHAGLEMPPENQLPETEIQLLEQWVSMGAPDAHESRRPTIAREKLWAYQPIQRAAVPVVEDTGWCRDPIDAFILTRLEKEGLGPAPEADRYTLLRRVTLDLTGLPPTPEEIAAFGNDSSLDAYQKVVNRLLASPGFGDHWARHWFDLSCYADLADIDGNVLVRDAWRYRDYVVQAFNSDKPLDHFIHEQIAGDLLPYNNVEQQREQIIATGYLAIGPWTLQNYIKRQLDADVVDHQIDRIGRTFLAQTISCARCHDHKFDPIPTRDYYALAGVFHSTLTTSYDGPGVWSQITHVTLPELPDAAARFERLQQEVASRRQTLDLELERLQGEEADRKFTRKVVSPSANSLTLQSGLTANEADQPYRVSFLAGPSVWADARQATGERDGLLLQVLRNDGTVLAYHVHHPKAWSGTANAQQFSESSFMYTGDGSGDIALHITASENTGRFSGAIDDLLIVEAPTSRIVFQEDFNKSELGDVKGEQAGTGLPVFARCSFPHWMGEGINHSHAVALTEGNTPNLALQIFSGPAVASQDPRIREIDAELEEMTRRLESARPGRAEALAVRDVDAPRDAPIYLRGDFQSLGDITPRGFLSAVPVSTQLDIPAGRSGRLQLAQWLTDSGNPLTVARSGQPHLAALIWEWARPFGRLLWRARRNSKPSRAARFPGGPIARGRWLVAQEHHSATRHVADLPNGVSAQSARP